MKTPFYSILELYEDAVLSHAHHDLTCTETAVIRLGAILNQFAETRSIADRVSLVTDALNAHQKMNDGVDAWLTEKRTQRRADLSRDQDFWEAHKQRMDDYRAEYKRLQSGLHASGDAFDALQFAPGPKLCRVEWDALKMMVQHLRTGDEAIVEGGR